MEIFLVVEDIDLGYASFGAFSSQEKARAAIKEFCIKESERLGINVSENRYYIIVHTLDVPCK